MKNNIEDISKDSVGVYIVHNPDTDETYIGSGNLHERLRKHRSGLLNGKHFNYKLRRAYASSENFEFIGTPIDSGTYEQSWLDARAMEQALLDEYHDHPKVLNIAKSVEGPGLGQTLSPETIQKIVQANTGLKRTPEQIERIRQGVTGNQNAKGLVRSPETKQKMADARTTYHANLSSTDRTVRSAKIRQGMSGFTMPAEAAQRGGISRQKPVVVDGTEFASVKEAAAHFGIADNTAVYRLKNPRNSSWSYK